MTADAPASNPLVTPPFRSLLPLYAGGMLGPLGTMIVTPMFPELRESFGVTTSAASLSVSVYLFPFAAFLLISGTIGERFGRRRVVRITFLVYAASSVLCALAPSFVPFLIGRALQGVANAFITPLLLAGLAEVVNPSQLGRTVGRYSSMQMLGSTLAPAIGGVAADFNWRYSMWAVAGIAALLSLRPPPGDPRPAYNPPPIRPLLSRRVLTIALAAFVAASGPMAATVLVGVKARDGLLMTATGAGMLIMVGNLVASSLGSFWGGMLDRVGLRRFGLGAATAALVVVFILGLAQSVGVFAAVWVITAIAVNIVTVVLQVLGSTTMPSNRGGALSLILAFRFAGFAVAPVVLVPLYTTQGDTAFVAMAAIGVAALLALMAAITVNAPASTAPAPNQ